MTVGIIGAGAWGTSLAYIASVNSDVVLYTRDEERAKLMQRSRENSKYLPDVELPDNISITSDKSKMLDVQHIIFAVPSIAFRQAVSDFSFVDQNVGFVSVTKGLEQGTNKRMSQVILDEDPNRTDNDIAVLSGPNLAHEIARKLPAATVVASANIDLASQVQKIFHTELFRVYTSNDVVGCEIAGVAKNVVAIAVGIGDGMGYGDNAKATVMTRALSEITRLGIAEGGSPQTFYGLAGIGDLIATCSSELSRNRTVGFALGTGKSIEEIREQSHDIAEGIFSAKALFKRAQELNIQMPIVESVAKVIENGRVSKEAVVELMTRPPGKE